MTTAQALAEAIRKRLDWSLDLKEDRWLFDTLDAALRQARREGLEEAAKITDELQSYDISWIIPTATKGDVVKQACLHIAYTIRQRAKEL